VHPCDGESPHEHKFGCKLIGIIPVSDAFGCDLIIDGYEKALQEKKAKKDKKT